MKKLRDFLFIIGIILLIGISACGEGCDEKTPTEPDNGSSASNKIFQIVTI